MHWHAQRQSKTFYHTLENNIDSQKYDLWVALCCPCQPCFPMLWPIRYAEIQPGLCVGKWFLYNDDLEHVYI